MTLLLLLGVLGIVAWAFAFKADLLSPWRIFLCVYGMILAVDVLGLSRFQTPWVLTAKVLFWSAIALFVGAWFIGQLVFQIRNPLWSFSPTSIRSSMQLDATKTDWRHFLTVFSFCIAYFLVSFGVSTLLTGGLPLFASDPDNARIEFVTATEITNYGIFFGPLSIMLGVQYLFWCPDRTSARRWVIAAVITVSVLYLSVITRFELFRVFLFAIVLYHYAIKNLRPWHLAIGFIGLLAVFLAIFVARAGQNAFEVYGEMAKIKLPKEWQWASNIYSYLATDFWNYDYAFSRYVEGEHFYPQQYGFSLVRPLLYLIRVEGAFVGAYHFDTIMNDSIMKIHGYNTVIFVWHFFKDFGAFGVCVLTMLGALVLSFFYHNTLAAPSLFRFSVLSLCVGAVVLSYHAPLWELWFFYVNLLVFAIAHKRLVLFKR